MGSLTSYGSWCKGNPQTGRHQTEQLGQRTDLIHCPLCGGTEYVVNNERWPRDTTATRERVRRADREARSGRRVAAVSAPPPAKPRRRGMVLWSAIAGLGYLYAVHRGWVAAP